MLRPAVLADLPALLAIRDGAGDDALSDPALVDEADLRRLIAAGATIAWEDGDTIAGFAAVDGAAVCLLVDTAARGKGIGRDLLAWACYAVRAGGGAAATLALARGGTAAGHYRAAGWVEAGPSATGGAVLKKPF
jgi:GNAT superfamily N-acetyltransferase